MGNRSTHFVSRQLKRDAPDDELPNRQSFESDQVS